MATGSFAAATNGKVLVQPHNPYLGQWDNFSAKIAFGITEEGVKVDRQEWKWNAAVLRRHQTFTTMKMKLKRQVRATLQYAYMEFV